MAEPVRMILDVDTGTDDALALALAARSQGVELVGVTTVAGNVPLPRTTENTLRVLAHLGAASIPVHRGFSRPLARELVTAAEFQGVDGLGGLGLPPSDATIARPSAPKYLAETIMGAPGEITLVCVGPLTNLAAAIALEPGLPGALGRLVLMGGALGRGNVTYYAEFNIYVDPEAAAQVFAACPLTMVGLDVTHRASLTPAAMKPLANLESPTARLVHGVTARTFGERAKGEYHLHDPLAVAVALDPTLCQTKRGTVTVETATDWCVGRTTLAEAGDGPHEVCVEVDTPRFLRLFAETLELPSLELK